MAIHKNTNNIDNNNITSRADVELTVHDLDAVSDAATPPVFSDADDANSAEAVAHVRSHAPAPSPPACTWICLLILAGMIGVMWYGYSLLLRDHDTLAHRLEQEAIRLPAAAYIDSCGSVDPATNQVLVVWNVTYHQGPAHRDASFLCDTRVTAGVMPLSPSLGPYRIFINDFFECAMTESKPALAWGMTYFGVRFLATGFVLATILILFGWWGCFHHYFRCFHT